MGVPTRPAVSLRDVAPAGDRTGAGHPQVRDVAHAGPMAHVAAPPAPGSLTVPPLFGWEAILTGLLLLIAVAVAFLVVAAARAGTSGRSEWQAWLGPGARGPPGPAGGPGRTVRRVGPPGTGPVITDPRENGVGSGSAEPLPGAGRTPAAGPGQRRRVP